MTAEIPGEELLDIVDRWIATRELITWPELQKVTITIDTQYHVALPMDLVVKLGTRQKSLLNVDAAPPVRPGHVAAEIFRSHGAACFHPFPLLRSGPDTPP